MLIAEELALLLHDDGGSPSVDGTKLDHALAGAILIELAVTEQVRISEAGEPGVRKGRVLVNPNATTADPLLAEALGLLRERDGRKPKEILGRFRKLSAGLRRRLLDRLTETGTLRHDARTVLWIFTVDRWPLADPAVKRNIGARLHDVLVTGRDPDTNTAALISMLVAIDQIPKRLGLTDRSEKRNAKQRAKQIADSDWAGKAVRKAVREIQSATTAAGHGGDGGGGDGGG